MSSRHLRPRATASVAVTPPVISDRTSYLVGLEARGLRDLVRTESIRHVIVGRRILVQTSDLLEALDRLAGAPSVEAAEAEAPAPAPPKGNRVLALIGRTSR